MADLNEDSSTYILYVCEGKPWCFLHGEEAIEAQKEGCPWCTMYFVDTETDEIVGVKEPGRA